MGPWASGRFCHECQGPARLLHPSQALLIINLSVMELREPPDGKHLLKEYLNKAESLKNQICVADFGDPREQNTPTDNNQMQNGDTQKEEANRRRCPGAVCLWLPRRLREASPSRTHPSCPCPRKHPRHQQHERPSRTSAYGETHPIITVINAVQDE